MYLYILSPSSVMLTNRLTQVLEICIDCSVNFSWRSKHIFNFIRFSFKSYEFF